MEGTTHANVLEVKAISKEMVKPSSLTPSHLRNFTLSYVDQIIPISPPFLTAVILFYPASPETQPLDIDSLKTSLSRTLAVFYPFAGRVKQSTITCTDEGIPFFEAKFDSPISTVLHSSINPEVISKLLPPQESLGIIENQPISELIHLSIQINIFNCGGVVIAWYDIHKITDGISSANFFKYWAAISSQRYDETMTLNPNFDMATNIFPPLPNAKPLPAPNKDQLPQQCSVKVKSFVFRDSNISKLKLKAATHEVPYPSRLLTVTGFIWEQALASKTSVSSESNNDEKTVLAITLDMRSRFDPQLPQGSIGNLVTATIASARVGAQIGDLVAEIDGAVNRKKAEIKGYTGDHGVKAMRKNWDKLLETSMEHKDRAYKLTTWCKVGFNDLDFGFGRPKWTVPTDGKVNVLFRNLIILNDYSDFYGDGIEAWLFLEEKEMENLESSTEFLAFASPVF